MNREGVAFRNISTEELASLVAQKPAPFLLDVREPFELTAYGAIPDVVNIPMGEVPTRLGELPDDRSAPLVVVCQSGSRSLEVCRFLAARGYTAVMNLTRGTYGWVKAGGEVDRPHAGRRG